MNKKDLIKLIKNQVCELAVGASALRNQGAPGLINTARQYFKQLDPSIFVKPKESEFLTELNNHTEKLRKKFPKNAQNWGAARKALNLFIRNLLYNKYLCDYYSLLKIEHYLELPLDSYTAKGLRKLNKNLPKWRSIKTLTKEENKQFQIFAANYAKSENIAKIHLDIKFWRNSKIEQFATGNRKRCAFPLPELKCYKKQ
ncbi:MAG: hypothetical protein ABII88_11000 [Candidatus Omnitrophota bacterium]